VRKKKKRKVVKQNLKKGTNESKISSMTVHNGFSSFAIIKLGPYVLTHYQWWTINEKTELISMSKSSSILIDNIQWHCMQIEFKFLNWIWNWNLIEFNSNLSKFNWKEMGCKLVEKVLKIWLWIWCWKRN
jgi:hypothetical protein